MRIIAVDWSGALHKASQKIWLAEAVCLKSGARLKRLECGRHREEVIDHLIAESRKSASLTTARMIVGFDFAFSFPAWFLKQHGIRDIHNLWELVAASGEQWIAECNTPFWGRPGKARPSLPAHFRNTELELPATAGIRPKSVFQIGGAGSVGTGSLRGMPLLRKLSDAGFAIWPFTKGLRCVLEIYPRLLTGPVKKSDRQSRAVALRQYAPRLPQEIRQAALASEDAFDAAVSALVMGQHAEQLEALQNNHKRIRQLEGSIWQPFPKKNQADAISNDL